METDFEQDLDKPLDMDTNDPVSGFGGRSAIAVFPLENESRTGAHDYVPKAFSDSLTVALSHMRQFLVVGKASSNTLAQPGTSQTEAAARLGARYIVSGAFSDHGAQYRLFLGLTDSTNGQSLWSDSYLIGSEGLDAALDDVCKRAAGTLEGQLEQAETSKARANEVNRSHVQDLVWRGRWHLNRLTREDSIEAKALFDAALEQDPDNPEALIQMGYWHWLDCWTKREQRETIEAFRAFAVRAMNANPQDGRGHFLIGAAEILLKRHAVALEHLKQSLRLNPSHAHAHSQIGSCHMLMGDPARAIKSLRTSLRLNGQDYYLFATLGELACAYCLIGEYERAIYMARRALGLRPSYWHASMMLISALIRSGEDAQAVEELNLLLARYPEFFERNYIDWLPFEDKKRRTFFEKSLKEARKLMRKRDASIG